MAVACLLVPQAASAGETGQSSREVLDYWTEERMASALSGDDLLAGTASPVAGLDLGLGDQTQAGDGQVRAEKVNRPAKKPLRTHGKVFFTQAGSVNFVCSGTAIKSRTKSLVLTAGHCTYSRIMGGYATNFMFAPAYKDGPSRFGRWTATKLKATPQWENSEDIRYDVAMATVDKRRGKKLQEVVGARGIAFDKGRNLSFDLFGYPAEERFDGQEMYRCDTEAEGSDNSQADPEPTRVSCDMTGGSSGGGWVLPSGNVNSVVSYGYECILPLPGEICQNAEEGNLFGPYFGGEVKQLYRSQKR